MDPENRLMSPPVLLLWTDAESGRELHILVHGPPEFLDELRSEGFKPGWAVEDRRGGRSTGGGDRSESEEPSPRVVVASP